MAGFVSVTRAYRTAKDASILTVAIHDVGPVDLTVRREIFRDSEEEGTARERVLRILRGFRLGDRIPAVEIVDGKLGCSHRFKLTHGTHRFYCSVAAGFTHVPVRKAFDINDPSA